MKDGLKDKYRQAIIEILSANPRLERAVLFGSRAMETFTTTSDVDIALFGKALTLDDVSKIAEKIDELSMPQRVDLHLHHHIKNEKLLEHIEQHGVEWVRIENRENDGRKLGDGWKPVTLKEAGVILIDCIHDTPPDAGFGYPYIAIPQMKAGHIDFTAQPRLISREHLVEWTKKAKPQHNDVVLSRRCNPGETAHVPPNIDFALGQNLVLIRADGTRVVPSFLRWLVRSPEWWEQISKYINVGAVFDSLRCADIPNFELTVPPLPEQRAISHILGTLDDKIELNRKMNQTLEEMARAIFKSWFIDFDPVRAKAEGRKPAGMDENTAALFPDSFGDSELGKIPKGWRVFRIGNLVDTISITHSFDKGQLIFLNTSDILNGHLLHNNYSDVARLPGQAKKSIRKHDILFSEIRPANKRFAFIDFDANDYVVSTKLMVLRKKAHVDSLVVYYFLKSTPVLNELQVLAESRSGTFPQITFDQVSPLQIVLPTETLLAFYTKILWTLFNKMQQHACENNAIQGLRDTLLPKLLSGEIRIKTTDQIVEGVT